jgi:hypothetical protein
LSYVKLEILGGVETSALVDTPAGLELELEINSNSSSKLTLTLNIPFQLLGVGGGREKSHFLVDPT